MNMVLRKMLFETRSKGLTLRRSKATPAKITAGS